MEIPVQLSAHPFTLLPSKFVSKADIVALDSGWDEPFAHFETLLS